MLSIYVRMIALFILSTSMLQAQPSKTLSHSMEVQGASIKLDVEIGRVELMPSSDNRLHIELTLTAADEDKQGSINLNNREISALHHFDHTTVSINESEDLFQHWVIKVPMKALQVKLGVGQIVMQKLALPIELNVGVGEIDLQVDKQLLSEVKVKVGVGDIDDNADLNGQSKSHLIGERYEAKGEGEFPLAINAGVAEVTLSL